MLVTEITAQSIDEALKKQLEQLNVSVESREVGTVIQVGDGIARVDGPVSYTHLDVYKRQDFGGGRHAGRVQKIMELD